MLQVTQPSDVSRSGVVSEQEFSIKRTAKAFQILSSGLYSNKILAIVRELSCNAWDAHVAAGNDKQPIEIKLPTSVDDTFYVKDFGTGLAHEQVLNIYTTYFESTKTDSNDYIGALGLGSKSPFSYTNSFVVESRFDGMKRIYTAFINEGGIPAIALMGHEESDEPNGITVMFSVKSNDRRAFAEAASEALVYFNPMPVLKGTADIVVAPIKFTVQGDGWNVRDSSNRQYVNDGPRVVQGFVSYPIDMAQVIDGAEENHALIRALNNIDMDIIVPIGDVEVAASRESLSYDKRTVANLAVRLASLAPKLAEELQHNLDECKSVWEATKWYAKYAQSGSRFRDLMFATNNFTYQGAHITDVVDFELAEEHTNVVVERRHRDSGRRGSRCRKSTVKATYRFVKDAPTQANIVDYLDEDDSGQPTFGGSVKKTSFHADPHKVKLIVDDIGHSVQRSVDEYMCNNSLHDVIVFRNADVSKKQPVDTAIVADVLSQVGLTFADAVVVLMSNITTKKPRTKQTYTKKAPDQFKMWTGFAEKKQFGYRYRRTPELNRTFSRLTWEDCSVDMNDPSQTGYYVPIERFTVVRRIGGAEYTNIDHLLEHAASAGVINANPFLIGVPEKDMKKINHKNWSNLFEVVEQAIADKMAAGLGEELARSRVQDTVDGNGVLKQAWNNMSSLVVPCDVKTFLDQVFLPQSMPIGVWTELLRDVGVSIIDTVADVETAHHNTWEQLVNKYDIWQCIHWDRCSTPSRAAIAAKYFNMCVSLT